MGSPDSVLESQCRSGSRANGEGMCRLEGLGLEGWRVVVVPGGWGVGENSMPEAREFPPQSPGVSLLLATLTLSQEALRLPVITL